MEGEQGVINKNEQRIITVRLPDAIIEDINSLVESGIYTNKSQVIRRALRDLLKKERWLTKK